jgi:hypothetical protein
MRTPGSPYLSTHFRVRGPSDLKTRKTSAPKRPRAMVPSFAPSSSRNFAPVSPWVARSARPVSGSSQRKRFAALSPWRCIRYSAAGADSAARPARDLDSVFNIIRAPASTISVTGPECSDAGAASRASEQNKAVFRMFADVRLMAARTTVRQCHSMKSKNPARVAVAPCPFLAWPAGETSPQTEEPRSAEESQDAKDAPRGRAVPAAADAVDGVEGVTLTGVGWADGTGRAAGGAKIKVPFRNSKPNHITRGTAPTL